MTHASNRYVVMVATAKVMSDLGPARIAALKPGELELMIAKHLPELTLAEIRDGLAAIEKVDAAAGKP